MEHWQSFRAECSCNGCKISTGCSVEGSSGTGRLNVVHCPVGIPGSSPLKGHDEYYKGGTARVFALCAEKEKAFCTEGVSFILRRNT